MEEKITFGKFIQQKRKEQGMTQKELADLLFITESAVSKWERGISYPDITLIAPLAKVLDLTEHELITSSDDYQHKKVKSQAKQYQRIRKLYLILFIGAYGLTIGISLLVNLKSGQKFSAFLIIVTSILVAFSLTVVPVIAKKKKALMTLGSFYLSLNLLFFACYAYRGGDWLGITLVAVLFAFTLIFLPFLVPKQKALIYFLVNTALLFLLEIVVLVKGNNTARDYYEVLLLTLFFMTYPWMIMILLRYFKVGGFIKAGLSAIITGVYVLLANSITAMIIERKPFHFLPVNFKAWDNAVYANGNVILVIFLSFLGIGLLFLVAGTILELRKQKERG
ncbi:MAG TPA: helix-turn-helix domain-containing protein [Candidatus Dorea intestinavium]|nr:helix-turn-helix domain-containing protein [Candidatus Dorea intestinavium]